jgi:hypothetical protein
MDICDIILMNDNMHLLVKTVKNVAIVNIKALNKHYLINSKCESVFFKSLLRYEEDKNGSIIIYDIEHEEKDTILRKYVSEKQYRKK